MPRDDIGVGRNRCLNLRSGKMQHGAVLAEHVHLLDPWDAVQAEALELRLKLLVVSAVSLVLRELLAASSSLATGADRIEFSSQLLARCQDRRVGVHWVLSLRTKLQKIKNPSVQ